eukprot:3710002-Rhodomonas_salina.6
MEVSFAEFGRTRERGAMLQRGASRANYLVCLLDKAHPRHLRPGNLRAPTESTTPRCSSACADARSTVQAARIERNLTNQRHSAKSVESRNAATRSPAKRPSP